MYICIYVYICIYIYVYIFDICNVMTSLRSHEVRMLRIRVLVRSKEWIFEHWHWMMGIKELPVNIP